MVDWENVEIIDVAKEKRVKEALYIRLPPPRKRGNCDEGSCPHLGSEPSKYVQVNVKAYQGPPAPPPQESHLKTSACRTTIEH